MSALREWYRRIRSRRSTDPLQAQVEEELSFHIEMLEQEYRDAGLSAEAARTAARRRFGDYDLVLEAGLKLRRGNGHLRRGSRLLDEIASDLSQGARSLLRSPAFGVAATLIIAVGIGANTAAFSVANAVLFRPLALPDADRVVWIGEHYPPVDFRGYWVGMPNLRSWKQRSELFESLAAAQAPVRANLTDTDEPENLGGYRVSTDFFSVLGTPPLAGRLFRAEDGRPGAEPVVLLGARVWHRRFASDPAVVGTTIHLDKRPYTVVGVASSVSLYDVYQTSYSRGNHWMEEQDFWFPMIEREFSADASQRPVFAQGIGRLKEGVTIEQARAELEGIGTVVRPGQGLQESPFEARIDPARRAIGAPFRRPLLVMMGAAGLVLLIMCANVANLLLSRTLTRRREVSLRGALGASRGRLVRQLLTESMPLVLIGGGLGLLGAWWMVNLLLLGNPTHRLPRLVDGGVPIDGTVAAFAVAAVTLTVLLCGLPPAASGSRVDLHDAIKDARGRGSRRRRHPAGVFLVGFEVALATVLVTAGGLLANSFLRAASIELGFDPTRTITAELDLPAAKYGNVGRDPEDDARVWAVYREILDETRALPGVEAAGLTWIRPLSGQWVRMGVNVEGKPEAWRDGAYVGGESQDMEDYADLAAYTQTHFMAEITRVSPGYFGAIAVPLISGEYLPAAGPEDPQVAVISESAARVFFPDEDPIGKRIAAEGPRGLESWGGWRTVVGVVQDIRQVALEDRPSPQLYFSHEQIRGYLGPSIVVRTAGGLDPSTLADELAAVVQRADPDAAMHGVLSLEDLLARQLGPRRLYMSLVMVFAGCAILLATVGVFAVIAYVTSRRTHEIGVRRALGARRADAVNLILRQGLGVVAVGVAAGVAASWALGSLLSGFLYEVEPTDPATFALAAIVLLAVAFPACLIPARRAARVDPIASLRAE